MIYCKYLLCYTLFFIIKNNKYTAHGIIKNLGKVRYQNQRGTNQLTHTQKRVYQSQSILWIQRGRFYVAKKK